MLIFKFFLNILTKKNENKKGNWISSPEHLHYSCPFSANESTATNEPVMLIG